MFKISFLINPKNGNSHTMSSAVQQEVVRGQSPSKNTRGTLLTCAGTVTCGAVDDMGGGFSLFKNSFNNNGCWKQPLENELRSYREIGTSGEFHKPFLNPEELGFSLDEDFLGGICTVHSISFLKNRQRETINTLKEYLTNPELNLDDPQTLQHINQEIAACPPVKQYVEAVKQAFIYAHNKKLTLLFQPLGIGIYGWDPQLAAFLFYLGMIAASEEIQAESNTKSVTTDSKTASHSAPADNQPRETPVKILMYDLSKGTNDHTFSETLKEIFNRPPRNNCFSFCTDSTTPGSDEKTRNSNDHRHTADSSPPKSSSHSRSITGEETTVTAQSQESFNNRNDTNHIRNFFNEHKKLKGGCPCKRTFWNKENEKEATLSKIFDHALNDRRLLFFRPRSFDVCVNLGWLTKDGGQGAEMEKDYTLQQIYQTTIKNKT